MRSHHLHLLFLFVVLMMVAARGEPRVGELSVPPLEKTDAQQILSLMGYERVQVVAVLDGVHQKGVASVNCATVLGLGRRDGCDVQIAQSFFHDRDLGWFYYETCADRIRIWNVEGFREVKP